eukprot:TRINITY_DN19990_c0_g1_i1.p1 TRINITY_DN19990_c0_g1~~TRINITY_DN19990_c0_g1_i1.p1  ORF type:complete len:624 (+),score=96.65 TRINITY_DN19990_c0_g1_i1:41-1912(+)
MRIAVLLLCIAYNEGIAVPEVREVTCTGGREVVLEVEASEVTIEGVVRFKTRVYRVDGEITFPSTTIRMQAGQECKLKVVNNLDGEPCTEHENGYHCQDTTSLHTHGLHVSPTDDNIDTHINPGEEHTYEYTIPDYHLMGTHWYHAHHHGSTALQALGGLAGMLLMDASPSFQLPNDIRRLYRRSRVPPLMLNYLAFGDDAAGGFWNFHTHKDLVELYDPVTVPLDLQWEEGQPLPNDGTGNFYVVNGVLSPEVEMVNNDAALLRMVHAGDGQHLCLELDDDNNLCNMTLLARDGVFHQTPYLQLSTIVLLQGTRADVAVICSLPEGVNEVVINIRANPNPSVNPSETNTFSQESILKLKIRNGMRRTAVPTSEVPFPSYLTSLMEASVQIGGETGVEDILLGGGGASGYSVNGVSWPGWEHEGDGKYVEEFCLDKSYQITLGGAGRATHNPDGPVLSSTPFHPYHQHINHFQIYDGSDNTGMVLRNGEWRDVVPSWGGVGTVVRMKPVRFVGEAVVHCHLLQHEDNGMMSLMKLMECGGSEAVSTSSIGLLGKNGEKEQEETTNFTFLVVMCVGLVAGIGGVVLFAVGRARRSVGSPVAAESVEIEDEEDVEQAACEGTVLL